MPLHASWQTTFILSSHLCLVLSLRSPHQNPICTFLLSHTSHMPHTFRSCLSDQLSNSSWGRQIMKFLIIYSSPLPSHPSHLGQNIFLNTLLSLNTLSLCSSFNVSHQASNLYKITGKILVLCTLIFICLDSKLESKRICTEWQQTFPEFKLPLTSSWIELWFVKDFPKYLNCSTLSKEILSVLYCDFDLNSDLETSPCT
jgi:hypothetical protein